MSMRMPSTTSPLAMLRTRPSASRVSCHTPGAPPGSARRSYSLACSSGASVTLRLTWPMRLPAALRRCWHWAAAAAAPTREDRRTAARRAAQVQAQRLLLVDRCPPARRPAGRVACARAPDPGSGSAATRRSLPPPSSLPCRRRTKPLSDRPSAERGCVVGVGHHRQRLRLRCPAPGAGRRAMNTRHGAVVGLHAGDLQVLREFVDRRSRWSSRSFGAWPRPTQRRRCAGSDAAMLLRQLVDLGHRGLQVLAHRQPAACRAALPAAAKRSARSPARASTTWRVAVSWGCAARSTIELRNCPAA